MTAYTQVIDETGAHHTLTRMIGSGGQGEVWLTQGSRRVVKLLGGNAGADAIRRQLAFVRRLDLQGLHVARPLAVLRPPHVGYVAEFLDEMVPITTLLESPPTGLLQWYINTGGLRRRLRLLAHAGEALAGLHGRGVIYADLSHSNVFVSEPVDAEEAWLIDLDNLTHTSDANRAVYTRGYGAPEVVTGAAGNTSLSDAWSFGVLVWRTLTLTHPLVGDVVDESDPEVEDRAFAGGLPWTGDLTDRSNSCSRGIPPAHVCSRRLTSLANQTFGIGLGDRAHRPGIAQWVDCLHGVADGTLSCSACAGTYIVTEQLCPWCGAPKPTFITVQLARWQPDEGIVPLSKQLGRLLITKDGLTMSRRLTHGITDLTGRNAFVALRSVPRGVEVRSMSGADIWVGAVESARTRQHKVSAAPRILPEHGWMVFFDSPAVPQRVALIGAPHASA